MINQISTAVIQELSLDWILNPISTNAFFQHYWEKEALFIDRNDSTYYNNLLQVEEMDALINISHRLNPSSLRVMKKQELLPSSKYTD